MENLLPETTVMCTRTRRPLLRGRRRVLTCLLVALLTGCSHGQAARPAAHSHAHPHRHSHSQGSGARQVRGHDLDACLEGAHAAGLSGVDLSRRDADGLARIGIALVPHALSHKSGGSAHSHSTSASGDHAATHARGGARHGHDDRFRHVEACGRAVLTVDPSHTEGWYLRGLVRLDSHDFVRALHFADHVLQRRPDHVGALLLASDARLERGELREAEHLVGRALAIKPSLPALVRAGHLRHRQGDDARAKQLYAAALRIGLHGGDRQGSVWAATEAAKLFLSAGDARGAEAGFDLALRISPDAVEARHGKARARLAQGGSQ